MSKKGDTLSFEGDPIAEKKSKDTTTVQMSKKDNTLTFADESEADDLDEKVGDQDKSGDPVGEEEVVNRNKAWIVKVRSIPKRARAAVRAVCRTVGTFFLVGRLRLTKSQ